LQDILESIADIETFTADISFEVFRANREKVLAVVKSFEILGEAVKSVPLACGSICLKPYSSKPMRMAS
jgi:uncharacterized protein with HEPN domain